MKATEQYFSVVLFIMQYAHVILFIMLYKVILTFEYEGQILKCDHSNESYWAVLFCDAVMLYKVALRFESVDKILKFDNSNGSYQAVPFCSAVYNAVRVDSVFWVRGWNPYHSNESY